MNLRGMHTSIWGGNAKFYKKQLQEFLQSAPQRVI